MNALNILVSISAEEILNYSMRDIAVFIAALIVTVSLYEKFKKWTKDRKQESYEEIDGETSLKTTVTNDHDRLAAMEKQVLVITRGVKEILKMDLMETRDRYMSRKPFPYITRYERITHISLYDAYAALDPNDPVIEGFHKELLELTIKDEDIPLSDNAGDI